MFHCYTICHGPKPLYSAWPLHCSPALHSLPRNPSRSCSPLFKPPRSTTSAMRNDPTHDAVTLRGTSRLLGKLQEEWKPERARGGADLTNLLGNSSAVSSTEAPRPAQHSRCSAPVQKAGRTHAMPTLENHYLVGISDTNVGQSLPCEHL